jgi:hypothetical protein
MRCVVSFVLEKGTGHKKYAEILDELHENGKLALG